MKRAPNIRDEFLPTLINKFYTDKMATLLNLSRILKRFVVFFLQNGFFFNKNGWSFAFLF